MTIRTDDQLGGGDVSNVCANVDGVLANAPVFHHYLDRHIALHHDELDPPALWLLAALCGGDPDREARAERVGVVVVQARVALWDGVVAEFAATE